MKSIGEAMQRGIARIPSRERYSRAACLSRSRRGFSLHCASACRR
jgi:hypothetical protein